MRFLQVMGENAVFGIIFYWIKYWLPADMWIGSIAESIILGVVWSGAYFLFKRKRIAELWKSLNQAENQ